MKIIVLTMLATTSIITEAVAFALDAWRSVDGETRVLEVIGVACAVAFVALLLYEHRQSRRE